MQSYHIAHHRTGAVLFTGHFPSLKDCVEAAVQDGVSLAYADLRRANLINAMLDDAQLDHALFTDANLMGANLSEARLAGADFGHAGLQNTCLCFAALPCARFIGAQFGATDIAGAVLDRAIFSTGSAWHLPFRDAASLAGCSFIDADGAAIGFSRPPAVITGFDCPVILTDRHIMIDDYVATHADFIAGHARPRGRAAYFLLRHRDFLQTALDHFLSRRLALAA